MGILYQEGKREKQRTETGEQGIGVGVRSIEFHPIRHSNERKYPGRSPGGTRRHLLTAASSRI